MRYRAGCRSATRHGWKNSDFIVVIHHLIGFGSVAVHPDTAGLEHTGEPVPVALRGRRQHLGDGGPGYDVLTRTGGLPG